MLLICRATSNTWGAFSKSMVRVGNMTHSERSALTVAGWCTGEIVGGTSSINNLHLAVAELGMECGLEHSEGDYQMVASE